MNYALHARSRSAAGLAVTARARFIMRTYAHLFAAISAFAGIEAWLFATDRALPIALAVQSAGPLVTFGGFIGLGWLFGYIARAGSSRPLQYAALAGYVVLYSVFFLPMLYMAQQVAPGAIQSAGVVTMLGFAGLTAVVFTTRKDFSFLGSVLRWGLVLAVVAVVASLIFGFYLGTLFSVAMVGLAGVAILHDTSNILHHYPEDSYVGAALDLFTSTAMMFVYVLRLFMGSRD